MLDTFVMIKEKVKGFVCMLKAGHIMGIGIMIE